MTVRYSASRPDGSPVTDGTILVAAYTVSIPFLCSAPVSAGVCELPRAPGPGLVDLRVTYLDVNGFPQLDTQVGISIVAIQEPIYQFAEGVTGPSMDTYALLVNPSTTAVVAEINVFPEGAAAFQIGIELPPRARVTLKLDDVPELADAVFAWEVRSPTGAPLAVERAVYFAMDERGRPRAGHVVAGEVPVITPTRHPVSIFHTRSQFTFAEGSNRGPFGTYLLLGNPSQVKNSVALTFLREGLPPFAQTVEVPPGRTTLDTSAIPGLAGESFAIQMSAVGRMMAERAQYLRDARGRLVGGLASQGQLTLGSKPHRYFAEGATLGGLRTYLLLSNMTATVVVASVAYHTASGDTVVRWHPLAPWARVSIDVATEDPKLAGTTFWFETDGPVAAERAMYWDATGAGTWTEGHLSHGAGAPMRSWLFAEGMTGGAWGAQTYLVLANPNGVASQVTVTYLRATGNPVQRAYLVPPRERLTVGVHDDPELGHAEFGLEITSTEPIVAERSIYWTLGGPTFVGGTCEAGQAPQ